MWLSISMVGLARMSEISPNFLCVDSFAFFTTLVLLNTEFLLSSDVTASLDFLIVDQAMQLLIAKFLDSAIGFAKIVVFSICFSCTGNPELFL